MRYRVLFLALSAFFLLSYSVVAIDVPTYISFQGKLANFTNADPYETVSLRIQVTNKSELGEVEWGPYTFDDVTDAQGVFDLVLGRTNDMNLTPGWDYQLVVDVDLDAAVYGSADITFGDLNPSGDSILVTGGYPQDATKLLMADNVTTVQEGIENAGGGGGGTSAAWIDVGSRLNLNSSVASAVNISQLMVGSGLYNAVFNVYEPDESTTQTVFTQGLAQAGINIITDYTANAYTPGVFWSTKSNNPSNPKAGIYLQETASGTYMYFGTSGSYTTGIDSNPVVIDYNGYVGINDVDPAGDLDIETSGAGEHVIFDSPGTDQSYILFQEASTDMFSLKYDGAGMAGDENMLKIRSELSGSVEDLITITGDGRVFIPNNLLLGDASADGPEGSLNMSGNLTVGGASNMYWDEATSQFVIEVN